MLAEREDMACCEQRSTHVVSIGEPLYANQDDPGFEFLCIDNMVE